MTTRCNVTYLGQLTLPIIVCCNHILKRTARDNKENFGDLAVETVDFYVDHLWKSVESVAITVNVVSWWIPHDEMGVKQQRSIGRYSTSRMITTYSEFGFTLSSN